jgi:hypothetical protein
MSDYWIIVIPESADFVPPEDAQQRAVALFWRIAPGAEEVKAETTPNVRLIDCGENLEHIVCPACDSELDIYWWQDRMQEEVDSGYPLRTMELPCCQAQMRVDQLKYDWPQGFSRFSVEAMNPDIGDLTEENMREFERLLGCKIRKILQHI